MFDDGIDNHDDVMLLMALMTGWRCSDVMSAVSHLYGTSYQAVCASVGSWHCQQLW